MTCNLCSEGFYLNDDCSASAVQCVPCSGDRDFPYETECKLGCVSDTNCEDCLNQNECRECKKGWYVDPNNKAVCIQCLDEGNYKDRFNCKIECTSNCAVCSSSSTCSVCKVGYYTDLQGQCEKCEENCDYCKDCTACYKCTDNYVLLPNGLCEGLIADKGWSTRVGKRIFQK
jgi:hypothetical protein